ncbi:Protein kinase-like domain containing protein [Amanita muscaria]
MFISHVRINQSFVGWGGYADVYKGEFRGKPVAVKMLRTNSQSDVCREALTWKSLSHKFILAFLGIYQEKAQLFLVSPFMKNGSLSAWRKKSDPSKGEVQKRLLEVAEGVQYIHSEGIVHGDIRGSNILLDSDFHVKIADFGLTRHLEATATKSTSFSPNFAAPELFGTWDDDDDDDWSDSDDDGTGVVRTHKSDVYAFGCLYYEIHFNAIPFEDVPYVQLMKQVTRYRKRPDRIGEPPLGDKAWKLIKRCWIHEASRRPTMEAVIESMVKWDIK